MADETFENVQRWTAKRRTALVLQILKGETSAQEAARKHGLTVSETRARALAERPGRDWFLECPILCILRDIKLGSWVSMATKAPLLSLAAALGALWTLGIAPARAQPSADRAGEIKTWREQCSDPDIDLRTAYVEAALAADDVAIARVCLRQSLESDNADIRNLGLRATLASVDRLLFTVKPAATLAEAQGNAKKLEALRSTYEMSHWRVLETGLVFVIEEADVSRGTSTWYPLANLSKKSHSYGGEATVIGDTVSWVGAAYLSPGKCHLRARLSEGARLEGTFKCGSLEPFPVSAALL